MAVLKLKLGSKLLEITTTGEGQQEMIKCFSFWSQLPEKCGCCGSDNIGLNFKSPKDNDYYGLKCNACTAEFTFHQKKEGGFYTTADDKWSVYKSDKALPGSDTTPATKKSF